MPTYSYRCTECGTAFDIQQAFTDDTLTECPSCHGALRKIFTAVGVTFSGSGFYRTDSRAKPGSGDSGSASGSGDSGSASGSGGDSGSASGSEGASSKKKQTAAAPAASGASSSGAGGTSS